MGHDPQGIRLEVWEAGWLVLLSSNRITVFLLHLRILEPCAYSQVLDSPETLNASKGLFQAELRELTLDTFSGSYAPAVTSSLLF